MSADEKIEMLKEKLTQDIEEIDERCKNWFTCGLSQTEELKLRGMKYEAKKILAILKKA